MTQRCELVIQVLCEMLSVNSVLCCQSELWAGRNEWDGCGFGSGVELWAGLHWWGGASRARLIDPVKQHRKVSTVI